MDLIEMEKTRGYIFFCSICVAVAIITPFPGMIVMSPWMLLESGSPAAEIFWTLRVPRAAAAFLAGAGLAASGMVFQAMFRNALASPFTLGISSGAAFGASLFFTFSAGTALLGLLGSLGAALIGAFISMLLVYLITFARGGFSTAVMLLAGVIINFFFSSLVMFIQYCGNAQDALAIMRWLMGSLAGIEPCRLFDLAFVICACSFWIYTLAPELDLLMAGEEIAASRGVNVRSVKFSIFIAASIMTAAIVSLTGPIGFVGMMIPHICRLIFGWNHKILLPATLALGGAFLTSCDLLARVILAPAELPIGIITAMCGSPFFLWTLFKSGRGLSL